MIDESSASVRFDPNTTGGLKKNVVKIWKLHHHSSNSAASNFINKPHIQVEQTDLEQKI